jgi:hypothetical protein
MLTICQTIAREEDRTYMFIYLMQSVEEEGQQLLSIVLCIARKLTRLQADQFLQHKHTTQVTHGYKVYHHWKGQRGI